MPTRDTEIARAIAAVRPRRPSRPSSPPEPRARHRGRWSACHLAQIGATVLLGLVIGGTAVLADWEQSVLVAVVVLVTSKYSGELVRTLAFALLGLAAGLAKILQSYADGRPKSVGLAATGLAISTIFAVLGGLVGDTVDTRYGVPSAVLAGFMTFGGLKVLEDRLRK